MDNSLTDHGDPEKRIAELEHRLAQQNRGAELPTPTPQNAATSRRFVASAAPPTTKQMMEYTYVLMFAGMASLGAVYMALFLVGALLESDAVMQFGGAGCCVREQQPGFGPHIAMLAKRTGC